MGAAASQVENASSILVARSKRFQRDIGDYKVFRVRATTREGPPLSTA